MASLWPSARTGSSAIDTARLSMARGSQGATRRSVRWQCVGMHSRAVRPTSKPRRFAKRAAQTGHSGDPSACGSPISSAPPPIDAKLNTSRDNTNSTSAD
jgi:hypothetical protein